jgi:hypothetical protein
MAGNLLAKPLFGNEKPTVTAMGLLHAFGVIDLRFGFFHYIPRLAR